MTSSALFQSFLFFGVSSIEGWTKEACFYVLRMSPHHGLTGHQLNLTYGLSGPTGQTAFRGIVVALAAVVLLSVPVSAQSLFPVTRHRQIAIAHFGLNGPVGRHALMGNKPEFGSAGATIMIATVSPQKAGLATGRCRGQTGRPGQVVRMVNQGARKRGSEIVWVALPVTDSDDNPGLALLRLKPQYGPLGALGQPATRARGLEQDLVRGLPAVSG